MASPVARVTDSVICNCNSHGINRTGTINAGSPTVTADGKAVARLGDTGLLNCGHTFTITGGCSAVDTANGIAVAKVGSTVTCIAGGTGTITSGSPNVSTN